MPFSLSSLSPKNLFNKIENRFPKIKKLTGNPKVKKVAFEILKALGLSLLAAGFGALVSTPFGVPMIIAGAVCGGLTGGIAYFAVSSLIHAIKVKGFPAHPFCKSPPIHLEEWLSDENQKEFHQVIEKNLKQESWFQKWEELSHYRSKEKMQHALWCKIQKGVAKGEVRGLISAAHKHPTLSGVELLKKISAEELFYGQLLEIVAEDLAKWEAWKEHAAILTASAEILPLQKKGDLILGTHEIQDEAKFITQFKSFIHPVQDEPSFCSLRLQGKGKSHAIFLQFKPTFRFYDSYSPKFGGMHEGFKTEEEGAKNLYAHLRGYHSRIRPNALKFNQVVLSGYQ